MCARMHAACLPLCMGVSVLSSHVFTQILQIFWCANSSLSLRDGKPPLSLRPGSAASGKDRAPPKRSSQIIPPCIQPGRACQGAPRCACIPLTPPAAAVQAARHSNQPSW